MPHNRVNISGTLAGGEVWSTSIRFALASNPSVPAVGNGGLTEWALEGRDILEQNLGILLNCLSTDGKITGCQTQIINNDGTLAFQSPVIICNESGLGTPNMPYQSAVVISALTGVPGASHRGRHFWPIVGGKALTGGRITTPTLPADILTDWRQTVNEFCSAAQTTGEGLAVPVVYSPTLNSVTVVTEYRCGDVVDTQRRRRDNLKETYSTVPFPA